MEDMNKIKIMHRLKKIEGQIRGIQAMIMDNRPYNDILIQISAVIAALNRINKLLLEEKVSACLNCSVGIPELSIHQNSLDEIIELIFKFLK